MAVQPIRGHDDPIVRVKAKKVGKVDAKIKALLDELVDTMRAAPGVGLAAPQVGVSLRVAVVEVEEKVYALVNPEIVEVSDETQTGPEGCLSIPGFWAEVTRPLRVKVRALDRRGKRFTISGEGFLARALQHELDHLHGALYIDRLPSLELLHRTDEREDAEETAAAGQGQR